MFWQDEHTPGPVKGGRGGRKGELRDNRFSVVLRMLKDSLQHVPVKTLRGYAKALVGRGFDSVQGLRAATVGDLVSAGLTKGHARQVEGAWQSSDSSSGSSSGSGCCSSSSSDSLSGDSSSE